MNGGVLGGRVGGVDDDGPLGATAVFTAAGLVALAASIPGVERTHSEHEEWYKRNTDT